MENAPTQPRRRSVLRITTTIAQSLIRISGSTALVLGVLFWTGNALKLIPIHMLAGIVLVLALWLLAMVAAVSGVHRGFVALALVWGLIVPVLGMSQNQLLPGSLHWMIQVLHLLVGIIAMGLGNRLASRIKQIQTLARQASESGEHTTTTHACSSSQEIWYAQLILPLVGAFRTAADLAIDKMRTNSSYAHLMYVRR
jgi:hypothetical protein